MKVNIINCDTGEIRQIRSGNYSNAQSFISKIARTKKLMSGTIEYEVMFDDYDEETRVDFTSIKELNSDIRSRWSN